MPDTLGEEREDPWQGLTAGCSSLFLSLWGASLDVPAVSLEGAETMPNNSSNILGCLSGKSILNLSNVVVYAILSSSILS